jgi:hypothetical protein
MHGRLGGKKWERLGFELGLGIDLQKSITVLLAALPILLK